MPALRFNIRGGEQVLANLAQLADDMQPALGRALFRFAELDISTVAKRDFVPVVTGALRSSIHVEREIEFSGRTVTVFVSAGGAAAQYGRMVHENPRSGRTGGFSPSGRRYKRWSRVGQWKFLEFPAIQAAGDGSGFAREASAELEAVIRGIR